MAWFEDGDLRRLAGGGSYQRGVGYVEAIAELDELADGVVASVHGSGVYRVRLYDRDGVLAGSCTCPVGQDGAFCKHCVAVGLTLLADGARGRPDRGTGPRRAGRSRRKPDLRAYLRSVDPEELVDLLVEVAADDPAVHRRAASSGGRPAPPRLHRLRRVVLLCPQGGRRTGRPRQGRGRPSRDRGPAVPAGIGAHHQGLGGS